MTAASATSTQPEPPASGVLSLMTAQQRQNIGAALVVIGATWGMHLYMSHLVMQARAKYEVAYPALYAPEKHPYKADFDSVQRAHQNTLETLWGVQLLILIVAAGPQGHYAAPLGTVYVLGRLLYAHGYGENGPEGRLYGAILSHFGDLPLLLLSVGTGWGLLRG